MKCITYRIDEPKYIELKQYCIDHNVSIQRLLDTYITTLLSKSEEVLPGEKKNTAIYCPYCGEDINCKKNQNE